MKIEVRTKGGLPIDRQCMEIISSALHERKVPELLSSEGTVTDSRGFKDVYRRHIEGLLPSKCPYSIYISKSGKNGQKIHFPKTEGEELIIQLSADGTKASLYSDKSGFLSAVWIYWKTVKMLLFLLNFLLLRTILLPNTAAEYTDIIRLLRTAVMKPQESLRENRILLWTVFIWR